MVLWLSTDFGGFRLFWWGGHLKLGVSRKRDEEPATDDRTLAAVLPAPIRKLALIWDSNEPRSIRLFEGFAESCKGNLQELDNIAFSFSVTNILRVTAFRDVLDELRSSGFEILHHESTDVNLVRSGIV